MVQFSRAILNLSFGGTCTSTSGGTLFFTLYEVEIEGTIYLKLASTETYWLQVGTGGTDRLKMTVNLAFNPPDGEQVRSGQFTVRSRGALDVFEWDYRNRLTSVTRYLATAAGDSQQFTTPSGAEVTLSKAYTKHYVYNVYDQLIYEYRVDADTPAVKDNETVYIVQGGQRVAVLEKTAGSYDVTHLLLPDPTGNRMLAEQYINGATSHTIWPLHDQQGTVIAAISDDWHDDQDDVQHFKYDAYGLLKFDTEQDPSLANRLVSLHAGRDWDEVSDLYYNNARWYDPAMQRFISQDPLGFAGGDTNLYRYCGNSPTNATDPSGQFVVSGTILAIAGVSLLLGTASTGALYHSASQFEAAGEAMGMAQTAAEFAQAQEMNQSARIWQAAGEVGGATAIAIAAAPAMGYVAGSYFGALGAAFGTAGTATATMSTVTFAAGTVGSQVYDIGANWNQMDAIDRFHSVGMLVGPIVGGGWSGRLTRSAFGVGYRHGSGSVIWARQAVQRQLFSLSQRAGFFDSSLAQVGDVAPYEPASSSLRQLGNLFNRVRTVKYPFNEVYVENPAGGYLVVDSYNPAAGEIVSRKMTQLWRISKKAAITYVREAATKYAPGTRIADVPKNVESGLASQRLQGRVYLEVPIQSKPVPQTVLDVARRLDVWIRDVSGKVY